MKKFIRVLDSKLGLLQDAHIPRQLGEVQQKFLDGTVRARFITIGGSLMDITLPKNSYEHVSTEYAAGYKYKIGDEVEVVNETFKNHLIKWSAPYSGTVKKANLGSTYDISSEDFTIVNVPEEVLALVQVEKVESKVTTEDKGFKSQQEIWEYLSIAGTKVVSTKTEWVYFFEDGILTRVDSEGKTTGVDVCFRNVSHFTKYKEPVQTNWYDNIPPQGILCCTSQRENSEVGSYNIIYKYDATSSYCFRTKKGGFRLAVPVTQEEANELIYKPTV